MILQAVLKSSPRVVLEEGKAALKLSLTIHVGAGSPAFQSFLSVNTVSVPRKRAKRVLRMCSASMGSVPKLHMGNALCSETRPDCSRCKGLT